jgi:hypothetical protein
VPNTECHFDDGPAECCAPKTGEPKGATCVDRGGLCAPIGGCLDAGGWMTGDDSGCSGIPFVCCVPHVACGDATIDCCDGGAVYRPACVDGKETCTIGQAKPIGTCP